MHAKQLILVPRKPTNRVTLVYTMDKCYIGRIITVGRDNNVTYSCVRTNGEVFNRLSFDQALNALEGLPIYA